MKKTKRSQRKDEEGIRSGPSVSIKKFAFVYLLLMGTFFLLIGLKPVQDIIDLNGLYTRAVVLVTAKILGIMSIPCTFQGSVINLPSISLNVRFGCNGLEAVMIYSVAVIAFPSSWRNKLVGIAAGFLVIQVINILRIAGLAYAGVYLRNIFDYVHVYVAQGMMIAVSLGIFFIYLHYANSKETATA